ncbi:hypothetical protein NUK34_07910 [Kerstersia gyiorum]|uniref:hypothetical protein n=1 Tax=Kerstersia gyiorum TaxID=206506 RepID=UPI00215041E2|nr:hypothetical protein [Kerstersia gyiorum]MCR4158775.1 hypothetical protein [Kerstersia gyiorum]
MDDHTPGAAKMVPLDQTAEIDIKKVRRYLDTCGCLAHSGVRALVEKEVAAQCRGAGPAARVNDDGFIVETGLPLAPGTKLYAHPPSAQAEPVSGADGLPYFAHKIIEKLARADECFSEGEGADIGRHWLDMLTQLGLLNRVQINPAIWEITVQGEEVLHGHSNRL